MDSRHLAQTRTGVTLHLVSNTGQDATGDQTPDLRDRFAATPCGEYSASTA